MQALGCRVSFADVQPSTSIVVVGASMCDAGSAAWAALVVRHRRVTELQLKHIVGRDGKSTLWARQTSRQTCNVSLCRACLMCGQLTKLLCFPGTRWRFLTTSPWRRPAGCARGRRSRCMAGSGCAAMEFDYGRKYGVCPRPTPARPSSPAHPTETQRTLIVFKA